MQVTLLGTVGWMPTDSRETACVYLRQGDHVLLLDAGTGVRHLLTLPDLVQGVARIDVCLSHFHLDHVVGLSYLPGLARRTELAVWGPGTALYDTPTTGVLEQLIGPPLFALKLDQFVSSVEELPLGDLQIGAFPLAVRSQERHTQPSMAFRVQDHLTYCTDTGYDPQNATFATGCDHLLHEAFYIDDAPDDTHTTPTQAAQIARDAGVSRLTLVHLDPRLREETRLLELATAVFPDSQIGQDLMILD